MKTKAFLPALLLGPVLLGCAARSLAQTNAPEHIGVYDSRVVAYAWFSGADHMRDLNQRIQQARQAKAAGQAERFKELSAALQAAQEQAHLQVFSTAPADEALAALGDRLGTIRQQAGVTALYSKWDEAELMKHPGAIRVDVTDVLAAEFKPDEKQLKMIESIKKAKPVSPEAARQAH